MGLGEEERQTKVNRLIAQWQRGDRQSFDGIFSILHEELRFIAHRLFAHERSSHTLQTDDLVAKLYLKLLGSTTVPWESYAHFLNAAARVMRQILIDHARNWKRRGDGEGRVDFEDTDWDFQAGITGTESLHRLIMLNQALERIQELDPQMARIADWKLSLGLTLEEISQILGLSLTHIKREWLVARKMLGKSLWGRTDPRS